MESQEINETRPPVEVWEIRIPGEGAEVTGRSDALIIADPSIVDAVAKVRVEIYDGAAASAPRKLKATGSIRFEYLQDCARCAGDARVSVETAFSTLFDLEDGTSTALDLDVPSEQDGFRRLGDREIDISEELRQRVYLALPPLVYCSADCKGLCSSCGADLNRGACDCSKDPSEVRSVSGKFDALAELLPSSVAGGSRKNDELPPEGKGRKKRRR